MGRPRRIDGDWFDAEIPANVVVDDAVYPDSAYSFAAFDSQLDNALILRRGAGAYDRATLVTGPNARIEVGAYSCLNGVYLLCEDRISIGAHCLLAWGVVLTDSHPLFPNPMTRRAAMEAAALDPLRKLPAGGPAQPIVVEDNVWIGFDSVILPGGRLGEGCTIGCKTVVSDDVEPYAVVAGSPPRTIKRMKPLAPAERERVLREQLSGRSAQLPVHCRPAIGFA